MLYVYQQWSWWVGETGIVNFFRVGETGVGEKGVGEMGQIIGETGVGEMGVGEMGVIRETEPQHDKKPTKLPVHPVKTQISLGTNQSSLSAWRNIGSLAIHWAHYSEDWSDWVDAQADLSLRWAPKSICWFCHAEAHFVVSCFSSLLVITRGGLLSEPRHDKTNKMSVRPAKTQISLGIRPVRSETSLCA